MPNDDAQPGLAPPGEMPRHVGEPVALTVDGHRWLVRRRENPGHYDFDWLSHPHGYGFAIGRAPEPPLTRDEMEAIIRDFLAEIDPATGYLRD